MHFHVRRDLTVTEGVRKFPITANLMMYAVDQFLDNVQTNPSVQTCMAASKEIPPPPSSTSQQAHKWFSRHQATSRKTNMAYFHIHVRISI